MAKTQEMELEYAFFNILRDYYELNKGKIKRNYTDLSRKFLNYNDREINPDAYLRRPQFEALEMYVFVKEFFGNRDVASIFKDYMEHRGNFADESFYAHPISKNGQMTFLDIGAKQNEALFKEMKKVSEAYPNYIYALTMGLGKTVLMATCIFYEFLVANKHPKDKRFCHNALVFVPDKTVLESLKWTDEQKAEYYEILKKANFMKIVSERYTSDCMYARNRLMVDRSGILICYLRRNKGGTYYTVNYGKEKGIIQIDV